MQVSLALEFLVMKASSVLGVLDIWDKLEASLLNHLGVRVLLQPLDEALPLLVAGHVSTMAQ